MILAIDTATAECRVTFVLENDTKPYTWESGRGLADGLIGYLRTCLTENGLSWTDVSGLAVFKGPGSFTGLRIGLTVCNTIADSLQIPIVGETGGDWLERAVERIRGGQDERLVMPLYGRDPNITKPRK